MEKSLQRRVDEALDAAVFENLYTYLMDYGAGELCTDLLDYYADLEGEREDLVLSCVEDYLAWYWERPGTARTCPRSGSEKSQ